MLFAVCEKTAGQRSGNFLDLNSACSKVLVPVKIFQFQDMGNENSFLGTFRGHSQWPTLMFPARLSQKGLGSVYKNKISNLVI